MAHCAATTLAGIPQTKETEREEDKACESGVEEIQQRVTRVRLQQPVIHPAELNPAVSLYLYLPLHNKDTQAEIGLHSQAVKVLKVLEQQCWRQVFENLRLSAALPPAPYKIWSTRGNASSAEWPTTEMKRLICLFSFDCNTSSSRCLHAAHVLLKKGQRAHAQTWRDPQERKRVRQQRLLRKHSG